METKDVRRAKHAGSWYTGEGNTHNSIFIVAF